MKLLLVECNLKISKDIDFTSEIVLFPHILEHFLTLGHSPKMNY